ncbi:hypothetical protein AYK26_00170 [Euryarchaeota archaeon SM23-78]|nr:MAG: hypothetical protein AYK26_00170 [Euryarchaeota archaeon SM23-78]MBW3000507.1 hypothetical protein [Candidatus Woesearchaeota archaeon]
MKLEKIIDGTKKVLKGIGLTGLGLILYGKVANADFFDGCRPPDKYHLQIDMRYDGEKTMAIPKLFGKKVYGFTATNLNSDKLRPYLGIGPIIKTLDGKLHLMPTLEFDTGTKKFNFTNYATGILGKGKVNIDNVTTLTHDGKIKSDISAGIDIYKGLRVGALKSLTSKDAALRIWYNPPSVKYILGLKIAQDKVMLNGRIHF